MYDCQFRILRKTYLKFLLLRIRAKLSYMAFMKRQSVLEMIVIQIYQSYKILSEAKCIPKTQHHSKILNKKFDDIFRGDMKNMFHHIVDFNIMIREEEAAHRIRNKLREASDTCENSLLEILS